MATAHGMIVPGTIVPIREGAVVAVIPNPILGNTQLRTSRMTGRLIGTVGGAIALLLSTSVSAHADCGELGAEGVRRQQRVEASMNDYTAAVSRTALSTDKIEAIEAQLPAIRSYVSALAMYVDTVETGRVQGCYGRKAAEWETTIAGLKLRKSQFSAEYELLSRLVQTFRAGGKEQPAEVGDCVGTRIKNIGTRISNAPESGSAIVYANEILGITYQTVPAIVRSREDDPVSLCLAPNNQTCPGGDARGAIYAAKNLRTGEEWSLPASSHQCGGA